MVVNARVAIEYVDSAEIMIVYTIIKEDENYVIKKVKYNSQTKKPIERCIFGVKNRHVFHTIMKYDCYGPQIGEWKIALYQNDVELCILYDGVMDEVGYVEQELIVKTLNVLDDMATKEDIEKATSMLDSLFSHV